MRGARQERRDSLEARLSTLAADHRKADALLIKAEGYLLARLEAGDDPELAQRAYDSQQAKLGGIEAEIRAGEVELRRSQSPYRVTPSSTSGTRWARR